jgi:hypothetical protein
MSSKGMDLTVTTHQADRDSVHLDAHRDVFFELDEIGGVLPARSIHHRQARRSHALALQECRHRPPFCETHDEAGRSLTAG